MKSKFVMALTSWAAFFLMMVSSQVVFAAIEQSQLPASTMPGVITQQQLSQQPIQRKKAAEAPSPAPDQPDQGLAGGAATQIKFRLNKIILEGNHIYSEETLAEIYQSSLGKEISVTDLQNIVQSITNYYRNSGYVLSRAILPPQRVANGLVQVRIIEGYVDKVVLAGKPGRAAKLIAAYGRQAIATKPLQLNTMEYYLRLANEVPGVMAKAVLQPSQTEVGASDLQLVTEVRSIRGFITYNNYGTRFVGPQQSAAQIAMNSLFTAGDSLKILYSTTPGQPKLLKFYDVSYSFFAGTRGLSFVLGRNESASAPGFTLAPVKIEGSGQTYYMQFQYPYIRERDRTFTLDGAFNYLDSSVTSFGTTLYVDHLRTLRMGGTYSFLDRFRGSNQVDAHIVQGLTLLGATHDIHSTSTSRFGGRGDFTRVEFHGLHLQPLRGRFTLSFSAGGQYAFNPLLSSEQFSFGGSQMGRGYDPSEIIGDRGLDGSLELRMSFSPGWMLLSSAEPYIFYDQGVVWNLKDVPGINKKQSAASTGAGTRFVFTNSLTGEVFIGQPLTKEVDSLAVINRGRIPRIFFGIVYSP